MRLYIFLPSLSPLKNLLLIWVLSFVEEASYHHRSKTLLESVICRRFLLFFFGDVFLHLVEASYDFWSVILLLCASCYFGNREHVNFSEYISGSRVTGFHLPSSSEIVLQWSSDCTNITWVTSFQRLLCSLVEEQNLPCSSTGRKWAAALLCLTG